MQEMLHGTFKEHHTLGGVTSRTSFHFPSLEYSAM